MEGLGAGPGGSALSRCVNNAKRMLGGMCLSVVLVACGGGGGGGTEPEPESVQSSTPGNPTAPPPTSPPPSPPPQSSTKLQPAWQTMQGNAAHTGHVPVQLGRSRPVVAWEWPTTAEDPSAPAIYPVVTGNGAVYVATESRYCAASLHALDGLSGALRWTREFPGACNFNPPAVGGDRVYVATTGHDSAVLWALRTDNGEQVFSSPYENLRYEALAPTVYGGAIYTSGGREGGVHAFDLSGAQLWSGPASDTDMYAPAVDNAHVYHYSGTSLEMWERTTGRHLGSILDTPAGAGSAGYDGAPMIGGHGNVIVYSRSPDGNGRVLSSFNMESRLREWTTARPYDTEPAVANGVVYAASTAGMRVDAIDEATGAVLWSWSPAPGQGDTAFRHNIIVTDDVLLVSTDVAVHAVDLATRQSIWRHDQPGRLALSGHFLFLATGGHASDGRLVALDLGGSAGATAAADASPTPAAVAGPTPVAAAPELARPASGGRLQAIGGAALSARVNAVPPTDGNGEGG